MFEVLDEATYRCSPNIIFETISSGDFFKLTGADEIMFDLRPGGEFEFKFKERGSIRGMFQGVRPPNQVDLLWNVAGFGRPEESTLYPSRLSP
jgi:uncharacterized protein YndB with AHSA1/START domain